MSTIIERVGIVCDTSRQTYKEWRIPNYFSLPQKADTCIESPVFYFSYASWYFSVYPNGQRYNDSVGWMSVYLNLLNSENVNVCVSYTIGIKSPNGNKIYQFRTQHDWYCSISGLDTFKKRTDLFSERYSITSGGMLTIFFVAMSNNVKDVASQTTSLYGFNALSQNFESLYDSQQKSDVTIKVKGVHFRAHKLILGTRSSVFSAMFEHDMKENSSGIVDMEDCDPETFKDFLLFIYTGKIEDLPSKNISQLFMLSDKYDVADLRAMLMDFMKENMCLEIVCQVASVADKFDKEDLRKSAKEMIIKNIKTLLPTQQWIMFMKENPILATEFLMAVIPDSF